MHFGPTWNLMGRFVHLQLRRVRFGLEDRWIVKFTLTMHDSSRSKRLLVLLIMGKRKTNEKSYYHYWWPKCQSLTMPLDLFCQKKKKVVSWSSHFERDDVGRFTNMGVERHGIEVDVDKTLQQNIKLHLNFPYARLHIAPHHVNFEWHPQLPMIYLNL